MCTTDYATEENSDGGTTADSVALRVLTQRDGCVCVVTLQNQTSTDTLYMRKYDMINIAVPEQDACGLSIDIDYNIPNNLPETKDPIECTRGTDNRAITLTKNGVLYLRSRIIDGTFSRGYCIQIYRRKNFYFVYYTIVNSYNTNEVEHVVAKICFLWRLYWTPKHLVHCPQDRLYL